MGDRHRRALLRIDRLDAAVGSRTNEIGLRMALGADRSSVVALILKWALVLIAFGLVLGVP
jgi:ABC-type antimicrobial peptide transport system permease subunit